MAAATRWSTSLCHCSAASGDAYGAGGLWRSVCATSTAPLGLVAGGVAAVVVMESFHLTVAVVAATDVVAVGSPVRWDRPTLEREVASPSSSYRQREGPEEVAMDRMSTIMVKPAHRER
jgi:hypothetical protein